MCEYSSRDVYSQKPVSNTQTVDGNSCVGRRLKSYTDIDRQSYWSRYIWLLNGYCWRAGSSRGRNSLMMRSGILALRLLFCDQRPCIRPANAKI
jgi:hypothetical protein